jgi:hypothetical protein
VLLTVARKRARLGSRLAVVVPVMVAAAAVASPMATAAVTPGYGPVATFATGGEISGPRHIAVDNATNNLLEADKGTNTIQVFAPDLSPGGTATLLTSFAAPNPTGIAIDQTSHAVYVSEAAPTNQIVRFISDGAPVPTYTVDPSFVSPILVPGPCVLPSTCPIGTPLAVDPTTHDLIVGDPGTNRVSRYTSTGAFVRAFDGAGTDGALHNIYDIAVSATKVFVVDYVRGDPENDNLQTPILQFDAQGTYEKTLGVGRQTVAITVDPNRDRLVAAGRTSLVEPAAQLSVYAADGSLGAQVDLPVRPAGPFGPAGATLTGIAVGGSAKRLYTITDAFRNNYGGPGIDVLVPAPGAQAEAVTSADSRSIHLTGVVNPEGSETGAPAHTTAHLEYSLDNGLSWTPLPDEDVGDGDADVVIEGTITGLLPHKSYLSRIIATDTQSSVTSLPVTVTTADEAPTVSTGKASDIAAESVTLLGRVTPLGIQTTYYFEYGETTAYGLRIPTSSGGVAGNGYDPRSVSRGIAGLKAGTLYHYRLVGVNSAGTTYGGDATVTTDPPDVALRGYEMVSPIDKQGVPVDPDFTGTRTSGDGNALVYATRKAVVPGSVVGNFVPRILSTRSATDGWSSSLLDLPEDNQSPGNELFFSTLAVSKDLKRAAVLTRSKLSPSDGAVEGGWNLYIREPAAHRDIFVASDPKLGTLSGEPGSFHLVGASEDLRSIVFTASSKMYDAVEGQGLRLVSRMPDGSAASDPTGDPVNLYRDANQVSGDGSRIYFQVGAGVGALYLRENGTTTVPISVSQRAGASSTPVPATFLAASPDGRYVEFLTDGVATGLTASAPDGPNNVYRYDVDTGTLTFVAPDVTPNAGLIVRPAQGTIYFNDFGLANLVYGHDGTTTTVAPIGGVGTFLMQASLDGRYLAFLSGASPTSYDSGGLNELYVYDSQTATLSCASCRPDGGPATGGAQIGQTTQSDFNRYFSRMILADGTVFFDTTDPLVSADVNGTRDVYSYHDGRVTLISRGTHPTASQFSEVSPDGSNVFFITNDRLVGQDQDDTADMYDARIGGGIPAQSPQPPPSPCGGSECQEPASGPTAADPAPTQHTDPVTTKPPLRPKAKLAIVTSSATVTTLTLVVQTSGRGRIRVTGARVQTTSRTVSTAGKYTLKVPLSRATRAARKAHKTVKLAVKVSVIPPFAAATTTKFTRTLGK